MNPEFKQIFSFALLALVLSVGVAEYKKDSMSKLPRVLTEEEKRAVESRLLATTTIDIGTRKQIETSISRSATTSKPLSEEERMQIEKNMVRPLSPAGQ